MIIYINEFGRITTKITPAPGTEDLYPEGGIIVDDVGPATHYRNGELLTQPERPSESHEFNEIKLIWEVNLTKAKQQATNRITTSRNDAESLGFTAFGKLFDSDAASIQRISVAVQAAQAMGDSYLVEWTCKDNSTIFLDGSQIQALPVFMAQAGDALHQKARTLKAAIESAQTLEEIESIQWS